LGHRLVGNFFLDKNFLSIFKILKEEVVSNFPPPLNGCSKLFIIKGEGSKLFEVEKKRRREGKMTAKNENVLKIDFEKVFL